MNLSTKYFNLTNEYFRPAYKNPRYPTHFGRTITLFWKMLTTLLFWLAPSLNYNQCKCMYDKQSNNIL